jgi:WhiB family redox-sensing transcriptional regulator
MSSGRCRLEPPSTFFPSDGMGVIVAQRICEECPVKVECLEYALAHRIDHGVWGGASERQRRRLLKARSVDVAVESRRTTAVA